LRQLLFFVFCFFFSACRLRLFDALVNRQRSLNGQNPLISISLLPLRLPPLQAHQRRPLSCPSCPHTWRRRKCLCPRCLRRP
jgi:hypothetical protein